MHWSAGWLVIWVGAVVASLLGAACLQARRRRQRILARWGVHGGTDARLGFSRRRRTVRAVCRLGAIALVLVALAGPRGAEPARHVDPVHNVLVVLDCSASMLAEDVRPSRLELARAWVRACAAGLPACRLGLLVFAGTAMEVCPLTGDHAAFLEFLDAVHPRDLPYPGSDLGAALDAAWKQLGRSGGGTVVVVSDGEGRGGDAGRFDQQSRRHGVGLVTVAVGGTAPVGVPRPDGTGMVLDPRTAEPALTAADPAGMRRLAAAMGGLLVDAATGAAGIQRAVRHVRRQPAADGVTYERHAELYHWVVLPALVLLVLGFCTGETVPRCGSTVVGDGLGVPPGGVPAEGAGWQERRPRRPGPGWVAGVHGVLLVMAGLAVAGGAATAERLDDAGSERALAARRRQAAEAPAWDRARSLYNLALALHAANNRKEARDLYTRAASVPGCPPVVRSRSLHNLAVVLLDEAGALPLAEPEAALDLLAAAEAAIAEAVRLDPALSAAGGNAAAIEAAIEARLLAAARHRLTGQAPRADRRESLDLQPASATRPAAALSGSVPDGHSTAAEAKDGRVPRADTGAGTLERLSANAGSPLELRRRLARRRASPAQADLLPW